MPKWKLGAVEQAFADAALNYSPWETVLDTAAALTDSFGAILLPIKGGLIPNVPFTQSMNESADAYFRDGWYLRDERNLGINIMMQRGVTDDLDISGLDKIERHPYYQEFLAPHGLRWFAGVRVACGEDIWCLSLQRTIKQGPFSEAEKKQLAKLSNHLSAGAALARAMGSATTKGAVDAFEISRTAIVLINRMGEIFQANPCAELLLRGEVRIVKRRLVGKDLKANLSLERAIHDLLWRRDRGGFLPPVPLPRLGRRPLLAYPAKLPSMTANAFADCQAIVILIDPDHVSRPAHATLQVAFGLSEAEARLAARLASGEALEEVTQRFGITKETGRNQLKSVFAKAGVHRQAELVALLAPLLDRIT
ncbi:DNA-binding CsgD family transcriptional regulator [Bradyrhizobium macuxiense]|uniref:DNA-binding CsgD family transcriptional regulator n=1 Tax=Bradyrhizobium macuxiense TaxID=1755647 RepID=A0A560MJL3_9BRAD|nr:helix-turn-helix transcriptional regulator [Bradyrhizobium macuxiense]TWC07570.1 DNA-binding CsgD family transcriptional regulator [Bradyrhizobium macuxiense]